MTDRYFAMHLWQMQQIDSVSAEQQAIQLPVVSPCETMGHQGIDDDFAYLATVGIVV